MNPDAFNRKLNKIASTYNKVRNQQSPLGNQSHKGAGITYKNSEN